MLQENVDRSKFFIYIANSQQQQQQKIFTILNPRLISIINEKYIMSFFFFEKN